MDLLSSKRIPQFRVVVNSRCGRACFYCRPSGEGLKTIGQKELPLSDLIAVSRVVREGGVTSIKLTGGDPALYQPLIEAVERLSGDVGFAEIEVISRHPLIGNIGPELAQAGVTTFNISFDTLNSEIHRQITGIDDHQEVLGALGRLIETGVSCKVNTVVMTGVNDAEIHEIVRYCEGAGVQTLKLLDVITDLDQGEESFYRRLRERSGLTLRDLYCDIPGTIESIVAGAVHTTTRTQGSFGHPMTVYTMPSGLNLVVKDSRRGAWYGSICHNCPYFPCHDALMALRLTPDMRLQFCLLGSHVAINLKSLDNNEMCKVVANAMDVFSQAQFYEFGRDTKPLSRSSAA